MKQAGTPGNDIPMAIAAIEVDVVASETETKKETLSLEHNLPPSSFRLSSLCLCATVVSEYPSPSI